jgi:soluble lytic murein transglycosylase
MVSGLDYARRRGALVFQDTLERPTDVSSPRRVSCFRACSARVLLVGAAAGFLGSCKTSTLPNEVTNANEPALSLAATSEVAAAPQVREPWKVAVAEQRWPDAAKLFDAAYEHPTEPALRYVRARIASELGDYERAVDLLNGLEPSFVGFTSEIERMRARAQSEIGPYEAAATYFQQQSASEDRLRAVQAWLQANRASDALSVLMRSRSLFAGRSASREAEWRHVHAQVATALGRKAEALEDYVWIALHAPTSRHAAEAVRRLETEMPKRRLTKAERYQRLGDLAQAGLLDAAIAEEQAIATAPGVLPSAIGVKRHLAWAYYQSRRDYVKAAELFEECARKDSSQVASDLFYAARAWSRAHQDVKAIGRYEDLIRKQPSSKYAVMSRQMIGRLWFAQGEWARAVAAYDTYLQKYAKSKHHRAAIAAVRHERAVTLLALDDKRAEAALLELLSLNPSANHRAQLSQLLGVAYLQAGNQERARETFHEVIATRPLSFAALAAAARLRSMGLPVPQELQPPEPEDERVQSPLEIQLPPRAQQLIELGLDNDAEAELVTTNPFEAYTPRSGEAACLTLGRLSTAKERYRRGQKVIREKAVQRVSTPSTHWAWECLYPTPYATSVKQAAARRGVEPSLVWAVMRQESAFDPVVASPAAAHGLMQIIEPTARSLARDLGVEYSKAQLLTPAYNIELGATYLGKLLERYDGQVALAAAAYNAGPGAASRWLETAPNLPLDLFVARILYDETRNYVQRVVGNWARYRYLEGGLSNIPHLDLRLPGHKPLAAGDY